MIKFLNIYQNDKNLIGEMKKGIAKIIRNNNFILGEEVKNFENNFKNFTGTKYVVGCANGTDAIFLALKSLDKKSGEVILPAMTYISTVYSVINAGFKPVLVDIEENSPLIDLKKLKNKITNKTIAIIPVHLYGSVVNTKNIKKLIKGKNIKIIDDCSQAHGAKLGKKNVGNIADISTFSFYPGKNLGAYGDAGAITTNNKKIYSRLKLLRNLGSDKNKYLHKIIGNNSRLDTIQACILNLKLKLLNKLNKKRVILAQVYRKEIRNKKIRHLHYSNNSVYHQFVITISQREKLIKYLNKFKIPTGIHYPKAIHQHQSIKKFFIGKRFRNSEKLSKNCLSLPIDPYLKKNQIKKISKIINSF